MKKIILISLFSILAISCGKDGDSVDKTKPTIQLLNDTFMKCAEIPKGKPFVFEALFKDNVALGSYSIDIHHNFDHHTHSTEAELNKCELGIKKDKATKPFKLIKTYPIKEGGKEFKAKQEFIIPNEYESGDYHFMVKVTDASGWTTLKGLSFKIID